MSESTYYLYRDIYFFIYLAPEVPEEYEEGCVVSEEFVLRHLHSLPQHPVRFTMKDQSYRELSARLGQRGEDDDGD